MAIQKPVTKVFIIVEVNTKFPLIWKEDKWLAVMNKDPMEATHFTVEENAIAEIPFLPVGGYEIKPMYLTHMPEFKIKEKV